MKIGFTGHESFVCRNAWLKKGFDYRAFGKSDIEDAVIKLGVGKNMVASIKYWLRSFNILTDRDENTEFATWLFETYDTYLEDIASIWLLHYSIIKSEKAYLFNVFFNEFVKERTEFTKEHLLNFLKRKTEEQGLAYFSPRTYESDVNVLLRSYLRANDGKTDVEEETSTLLIDLNLLSTFQLENTEGKFDQWYSISRTEREDLPIHVLLFAILDNYPVNTSISFFELLEGYNSPGVIFNISEKGLENKIKSIVEEWPGNIMFNNTAGNRVLKLRTTNLNKWEILNGYYN